MILLPPYLKHHTIGAPPATIIPFHCCPMLIVPSQNNTQGDELANPLSLIEQLIDMWNSRKMKF
jgi:hypothetical protein